MGNIKLIHLSIIRHAKIINMALRYINNDVIKTLGYADLWYG